MTERLIAAARAVVRRWNSTDRNSAQTADLIKELWDAADALAAQPAADPTCEHCDGTGEVLAHADTCHDDLCALNGDEHSCVGRVESCSCIASPAGMPLNAERFIEAPDVPAEDTGLNAYYSRELVLACIQAAIDDARPAAEPASIHLQDLKNALADTKALRDQLRLMEEQAKGEVWRWQGDGTDNLDSMGARMGVLIYASDLKALIAAQPARAGGDALDWPKLRHRIAMVMLGFHDRPTATLEAAERVLDAVSEPDGPIPELRAALAAAPQPAPHIPIADLLRIYDEQKGDWCAIAREVERRTIAACSGAKAAPQPAPAEPKGEVTAVVHESEPDFVHATLTAPRPTEYTLEATREEGKDWYITVTAENGMRDYLGYWKDSAHEAPAAVLAEAVRGVCLGTLVQPAPAQQRDHVVDANKMVQQPEGGAVPANLDAAEIGKQIADWTGNGYTKHRGDTGEPELWINTSAVRLGHAVRAVAAPAAVERDASTDSQRLGFVLEHLLGKRDLAALVSIAHDEDGFRLSDDEVLQGIDAAIRGIGSSKEGGGAA